jgi:hypothetical protein
MEPMRHLVFLAALLASAGAVLAQPIQYAQRHIEKILPGCGDKKDGCYRIVFDYVEIVGGEPAAASYRINHAIGDYLGSPDRYFAEYDDPRGAQWSWEKSVKVLRADPSVISLRCFESSYTGGAHPSTDTTYLNFNAGTGEKLKLSDILRDEAMPQLTRIAEMYFRKKRNLAPDADLEKEGFIFFKDNRFALNDNFGITESALRFTFNAYEVAPYAWGPTEFEIPFSAIRDLLLPESGL